METLLRDRTSVRETQKPGPLTDYVCWSRMHAESGEDLCTIIARKELERRAGNGLFFWGVGNAPALAVHSLARLQVRVPVIFSLMKSRPKPLDLAPSTLLVWRSYFDLYGVERHLPPNVLVTSRATTGANDKKRHFALMCSSLTELKFTRGTPFDPSAYRNAGGTGAAVGSSQVTALLRRVAEPKAKSDYEANVRAELTGSFWVRLSSPIQIPANRIELYGRPLPSDERSWIALVNATRAASVVAEGEGREGRLF